MKCAFLLVLAAFSAALLPTTARGASPEVDVSLKAAYRYGSTGYRSTSALLEISVPLDVPSASRRAVTTALSEPDAPTSADPQRTEEWSDDVPAFSHDLLERVLPLPVARGAVRAALRASGFRRTAARLSSLGGRSRSSAALPDLKLRAGRSTDQSLRLAPTESDPYRYTRSGGYDFFFEGTLTFKLGRLVFASEEIAVERLRAKHAAARIRIVEKVLAALFAWQRARFREADATLSTGERVEASFDALEAEIRLDVLTGGWFGDQARRGRSSTSR